jgi:lipopolysaccharide/colanic/teichoic acid biosynthesis glycosyltransferase
LEIRLAPARDILSSAEGLPAESASFYVEFGKRAFDIFAGSLLLILVLPLMAVLMAIVARDGGAPLFAHNRIGRGGRTFRCLKIRTMVLDAETRLQELLEQDPDLAAEWARDQKLAVDPRVTRFGHFLRRTSLDELPQLINVVRGEMSLVGPRPVTAPEVDRYGPGAEAYLSVRPGLTGPWQVEGRNDIAFSERVLIDQAYARQISFLRDLKIVLLTTRVVLAAGGR